MINLDILLQQILNGLVLGSVYALVALGYTMVYGILQLINFAHGDVLMVGAMVGVTVVMLLAQFGLPGPVVLVLAVLAAVPVCVLLSLFVERVAYRPLRNAPRLAPLGDPARGRRPAGVRRPRPPNGRAAGGRRDPDPHGQRSGIRRPQAATARTRAR